jgi:hypothetical protein
MSSRSPFQLEPRNTYRLIFSDSGVLTAKSNSWFNSIARWDYIGPILGCGGGKSFTDRTSIVTSCAETGAIKVIHLPRVAPT